MSTQPSLSENRHPKSGLSGSQVKYYEDIFRAMSELGIDLKCGLGICVISDKKFMDEHYPSQVRGSGEWYYVVDGMHRLVGYGSFVKKANQAFDAQVYYCCGSSFQ